MHDRVCGDDATGYHLAVDFGTSNTVAVLRRGADPGRPLLFDGSPLLPSAVCIGPDGDLLTGRDALHEAMSRPSGCELTPKRRVGEETVLLDGRPVAVVALVTAVLRRVRDEAVAVAGAAPSTLVMTHPDGWGAVRRGVLATAASAAELPDPRFVREPAAATGLLTRDAATGRDDAWTDAAEATALIYDFGGGTFDASVVRRTADGVLAVLASDGLSTVGGVDIDAAIVEHLGTAVSAIAPQAWHRLRHSQEEVDRRARWQLWENVRHAKERLSRAPQARIHIPLVDTVQPLDRVDFERLAAPIVARTVALALTTLGHAAVGSGQLTAVYLVGGSSRIPLVATALHRALHIEPTALRQPELAVAEGAAVLPPHTTGARDTPGSEPAGPATGRHPARSRRSRTVASAGAFAAGMVAGVAASTMGYPQPFATAIGGIAALTVFGITLALPSQAGREPR
jgi:molecular chaperone DnaK (HSP70)